MISSNMKTLFCVFVGLIIAQSGETQQIPLTGQVTIHNSGYTTGRIEPVQNAYVSASVGASDDTDVNGQFQLVLVGIQVGATIQIKVEKQGYEVVNPKDLQVVVGRKKPLRIYLATPAELAQARIDLYNVSLRELMARHERQIARLRKGDRESQAEIARLEEKLHRQITSRQEAEQWLTGQLQHYQNQLPELVGQLALQNLDFASAMYLKAYEHLRAGEIEQAITALDEAQLDAQAQDVTGRLAQLDTGIVALETARTHQQQRVGQSPRASLLDWDCHFARCNTPFFGNYDHNFFWEVAGADFDDLATPEQGVCAVEIYFDHHFVSDLQMTLISPAGQVVPLVRVDFPNDSTHAAQWGIKFVSCNQPTAPDSGMFANFDDNYWPKGQRFTGVYYPSTGCLENFDTGPVNGKWTLRVTHTGYRGMGFLHGFKIEFWQNQGLYCTGLYHETTRNRPENTGEMLPRDPRTPDPAKAAEEAAKALRDNVINSARDLLGTPYKYGGNNSNTGYDCSNFTRTAFQQNGIEDISPSSQVQSTQGRFVWLDKVQPADLIFFGTWQKIQHVALVVKRTEEGIVCIHSTTSKGVMEEDVIKSSYWKPKILFARDVITPLHTF
jgi:cell wall-associated NlpC family hydrolase